MLVAWWAKDEGMCEAFSYGDLPFSGQMSAIPPPAACFELECQSFIRRMNFPGPSGRYASLAW
jgi:hypothetical protein